MKYILLLGAILLVCSCQKLVLGEEEINSPVNNFELFWNDFDEHYALFEVRGWNWDSIYNEYKPLVTSGTTDDELWEIFKEMINYLDDTHTSIDAKGREGFSSGSTLNDLAEDEFDLDLVTSKYVEGYQDIDELEEGLHFGHGTIKDKTIGYIHINGMDDSDPEEIDAILEQLRDAPAIIFDIRNNSGGDDTFSRRLAGSFSDGEHLAYTVETRNGPNYDDFDKLKEFYTLVSGPSQYTKPVIILTDRYTVSAAEIFLLYMKQFAHVRQIGDSTSGDFSDVSPYKFLPNGWVYAYSIMKFLQPDGTSLDGIGHVPDVYIKNTIADIEAGNDMVIVKAVQYLFDEFGIE